MARARAAVGAWIAGSARRAGIVLDARTAPGGPGRLDDAGELERGLEAAEQRGTPVLRAVSGARTQRKDLGRQPRDCALLVAKPDGRGLLAVAEGCPHGTGDAAIAAVAAPLAFEPADQADLARVFDARSLTVPRRAAREPEAAALAARIDDFFAAPPATAGGLVDGARVPAAVAAGRKPLPPAAVLDAPTDREQDALLALYGGQQLLCDLGAEPSARDRTGSLYRLPSAATPIVLLRVIDASTGRAPVLRVPPWVETPHEAAAWSFGLPPERYAPGPSA